MPVRPLRVRDRCGVVRLVRHLMALLLAVSTSAIAVPPSVEPVQPVAGRGGSQEFTFSFADTAGVSDIGVVNILINSALDGRNACYIAYSRADGTLYLVNDPGTGLSWSPIRTGPDLSNSQCTLAVSSSSALVEPNRLTLRLRLTFTDAFAGNRIIYVAGRDTQDRTAGWVVGGTYSVLPAVPDLPMVAAISPAGGAGLKQTFSVTYRDTAHQNFRSLQLLVNKDLDGRGACYLGYDRVRNLLYLVADDGSTLLDAVVPGAGSTAGSGVTSNSQCSVDGKDASYQAAVSDFTLTAGVTFRDTFAGAKLVYAAAQTEAGANTGWQPGGIWTVGAGSGPALVGSIPANSATGVPINSAVVLWFGSPLDAATVSTGTVKLRGPSGIVAGTVSAAPDGKAVVFVPAARLSATTAYRLETAGLRGRDGVAAPDRSVAFTTGSGANTVQMQVISSVSPGSTAEQVPTNVKFSFVSTTALNPVRTLVKLSQSTVEVPTTSSVSPDGLTMVVTPLAPLKSGTIYNLNAYYFYDVYGNSTSFYASFTAGYSADSSPARLTAVSPANGQTGLPLNTVPVLAFSEPVDLASAIRGITWSAPNGSFIPFAVQADATRRVLTLVPATLLAPNTNYSLRVSSLVTDISGNAVAEVASGFQTGAAADLTDPAQADISPVYGTTVPTNMRISIRFNKRIAPASVTANLSVVAADGSAVALTPAVGPDERTVVLTPVTALRPDTSYWFHTPVVLDLTGRSFPLQAVYLTTASGSDDTAPAISHMAPPQGYMGVPVNVRVRIRFSEPMDRNTVLAGLRFTGPSGAIAFSAVWDENYKVLSLLPALTLPVSSTFQVALAGASDLAGNLLPEASFSFSTGASVTPDNVAPGVLSRTPASGSVGIDPGTAVVFTFNEPIREVASHSLHATIGSSYYSIPAGVTLTGQTVTVRPAPAWPAGARISVYFSVTDYAGNLSQHDTVFTTVARADVTPPSVTSVSPENGAGGLLPDTVVTLTFSEPVIVSEGITLFAGNRRLSPSVSTSSDGRSITVYSGNIPEGTITVVATSAVTDLFGNQLTEFRSTFRVVQPDSSSPKVVSQRPAPGSVDISPSAPITVVFDRPVSLDFVQRTLRIQQSGTAVSGSAQLFEGGRVATFTPVEPFGPGAIVGVAVSGTGVNSWAGSFTVVQKPALLTLQRSSPLTYPYMATNAQFEYEFSQDLESSTVTTEAFRVAAVGGSEIPVTLSLVSPRRVRIVPVAELPPNTYIDVAISAALRSTGAAPFTPATLHYRTSAGPDATTPTVTAVAPPRDAVDVGTNGVVRVEFSAGVTPSTITPDSIRLSAGGQFVPVSYLFTGNRTVIVSPIELLKPVTRYELTITGVQNDQGRTVPDLTRSFFTGTGVDTASPRLLAASVAYDERDVPVNSPLQLIYSEPVDPASLTSSNFRVSAENIGAITGELSLSADQRVVTFVPAKPFPVSGRIYWSVDPVRDLSGNVSADYPGGNFSTSFASDSTPPGVVAVNPPAGMADAPLNSTIQVLFTETVSGTSLERITLRKGSAVVPTAKSRTGRVVTLTPESLLDPRASYTIEVGAASDLAGNIATATVQATFVTGAVTDLIRPSVSVRPLGTSAGTNATVIFTASERINAVAFLSSARLARAYQVWPAANSVSSDGLTASIVPARALMPDSTYDVGGDIRDVAGNPTGWYGASFTTRAGIDLQPPALTLLSPSDGASGVPVNARVDMRFSETVFTASSIRLYSASGTVSVSSSGVPAAHVTLTPVAALAPSTVYTVALSGISDATGNVMPDRTFTFRTAASPSLDQTGPAMVSASPAANAVNVPVTANIVLTFNEPLSTVLDYPCTLTSPKGSIAADVRVAAAAVTLDPVVELPPGNTVTLTCWYIRDLVGNSGPYITYSFRTGSSGDVVRPAVVAVTPADGALDQPKDLPITLVFSEPLDPSTVNDGTLAVFDGSTKLSVYQSLSSDYRTVQIGPSYSSKWPSRKALSVVATSNITDLAGNMLLNFSSSYTTGDFELLGTPYVAGQSPANSSVGVAPSTPVTLQFSVPMLTATLPGALRVAENGVLIPGSLTNVSSRGLTFTPAQPFAHGARVEVFVDSTATAESGASLLEYRGSFLVAPAPANAPLVLTRVSPLLRSIPADGSFEVEFSKPVEPSTVTSSTVGLSQDGRVIPAEITLRTDRVARIVPLGRPAESGEKNLLLSVSGDIAALDGTAMTPIDLSFAVEAESAGSPGVIETAVRAGSIALRLDAPVNPLTVDEVRLVLTDRAGNPVRYTTAYEDGGRLLLLTPEKAVDPEQLSVRFNGVEGISRTRVRAREQEKARSR